MECRPIEELNAQGWIQQFTASGARAREAVELYRLLGFEVKTIPINELDCNGCTLCFESENDDTVMIMTRDARSKR